jgi:hypothetical protein
LGGDAEAWSFWEFLATSWSLFLGLWVMEFALSAAALAAWMFRQIRGVLSREVRVQRSLHSGESTWLLLHGEEAEPWDVRDRPAPLEPGRHRLAGPGRRLLDVDLGPSEAVR